MSKLGSFGTFIEVTGKMGTEQSTAVPVKLLQNLKSNNPCPISCTTLAVTLNASVTNPWETWCGDDFIKIRETKTYTFVNGTNTVFLNSSGVTAAAQVTAATVYYFYVGLDTDGALQMYPSASAPSYVEGPYQAGRWSHPGTSRGKYWAYAGFAQNTATTPALALLVKRGWTYNNPVPTAMAVVDVATVSTAAVAVDLSTMIPHHPVQLGGYIQGDTGYAVATTFSLGATSLSATSFIVNHGVGTQTTPAYASFYNLCPDSNGYLWAASSASYASGCNVVVTTLKDVV